MNNTYYFSHDYNARTDPKVKRLLARHGMAGYGLFWAIVEDLYNNANALPTDCEGIAYDLRADANLVESVINDFDLFTVTEDGKTFGSLSVERRLNEREDKSSKARNSAFQRWNKRNENQTDNANAMQSHSDRNAIKERKGKETKGKERKEKENIYPPEDEFLGYCKTLSVYSPAYDFALKAKYAAWVESKWTDGNGKKIKNWKTKIQNTFPYLKKMENGAGEKPNSAGAILSQFERLTKHL